MARLHEAPGDQREGQWVVHRDVFDRLRDRRILFLHGALDQACADRLAAELLTLEADGSSEIRLLINSPGGPVASLFPVTDTISLLHCRVATTCTGAAMGTAAAVLAAGTGRRQASAHARLSVRIQSDHRVDGTAEDVARAANQLEWLHQQLATQLAAATGKAPRRVAADLERGAILSGEEAIKYGLIDGLIA